MFKCKVVSDSGHSASEIRPVRYHVAKTAANYLNYCIESYSYHLSGLPKIAEKRVAR